MGKLQRVLEWIPLKEPYVDVDSLFEDHLNQHIRIYGLADTLKDLCIDILGLSYDQAYGTDEDKNSLTNISWSALMDQTLIHPKK